MYFNKVYTSYLPQYPDISGIIEYENFTARRFYRPDEEYDVKSPMIWMKTQMKLRNEKVLGEMKKKRDQNSSKKKEELINGGKSFPERSLVKDKGHGKQSRSERDDHQGGPYLCCCNHWDSENSNYCCRNWISPNIARWRLPLEFYCYDYYDINWNGSRRRRDGHYVNHYYGCLNKTNAQRDRKIRSGSNKRTVNQHSKSVSERDNYNPVTLEAAVEAASKKRERHDDLKCRGLITVSKSDGNAETQVLPSVTSVARSQCVNKCNKGLDENLTERGLDGLRDAKFNTDEFRDVEQLEERENASSTEEETSLNGPPVKFYNDPYDLREQHEIIRLLRESDNHHELRMNFARDKKASAALSNPNQTVNNNNSPTYSTDDSLAVSPEVKIIMAHTNMANLNDNAGKPLPISPEKRRPNNNNVKGIDLMNKITLAMKDNVIVINKSPGKTVTVIFDDKI